MPTVSRFNMLVNARVQSLLIPAKASFWIVMSAGKEPVKRTIPFAFAKAYSPMSFNAGNLPVNCTMPTVSAKADSSMLSNERKVPENETTLLNPSNAPFPTYFKFFISLSSFTYSV